MHEPGSRETAIVERGALDLLAAYDRGEPGPISLGYRVFASKDDDLDDYQTVVYKKGAWVIHMLRILMLDLKTMSDDRFTGIMRDFYLKYEGRRASTEDFRKLVEKQTEVKIFGEPMRVRILYFASLRERGRPIVRVELEEVK